MLLELILIILIIFIILFVIYYPYKLEMEKEFTIFKPFNQNTNEGWDVSNDTLVINLNSIKPMYKIDTMKLYTIKFIGSYTNDSFNKFVVYNVKSGFPLYYTINSDEKIEFYLRDKLYSISPNNSERTHDYVPNHVNSVLDVIFTFTKDEKFTYVK